jgi:hypothetical protein
MKTNTALLYCIIIAAALVQINCNFDISQASKLKCNTQTTLEFQFSSETTVTTSAIVLSI